MSTELSEEEKRQLADILLFNAQHGSGWELRGRVVRSARWSGIRLAGNSVLEDVDLLGVDLSEGRMSDTAFIGVDFSASDLSGALLERCRFERCKLPAVQLKATHFQDCTFSDIAASDLNATAAVFTRCHFDRFKDLKSLFKDAALTACEFTDSELELTSFSHCQFEDCFFGGGHMENVRFSDFGGKQVRFKQVLIRAVAFDGGTANSLNFAHCELRQLAFKGLRLSTWKIEQSRVVEELSVVSCQLDDAVVEGSQMVEASYFRSKLGNIRFETGRYVTFAMEECELGPGSTFRDVTLHGANFGDSVLEGTLFDNCSFDKYIVLNGTRLRGVRFQQPRFGKGLEVDAAGVVYEASERFPKS